MTLKLMFGKDLLYLLGATLQVITALLVTPIVTRVLGPSGYGNVALAIAISQVLAVLTCFGLQTAIQRENADPNGLGDARRLLGAVWLVGLIAAAGLALTASSWSRLFLAPEHDGSTVARYAAIWGSALAINTATLALLRSRERLRVYLAVSAIQSVGGQLLGLVLVYTYLNGAVSYLTGMVIAQVAAALVGAVALRPRLPLPGDRELFRRVLLFSLPLIPQQLSSFILIAGDRLVVQRDLGSASNGRYSAAYVIGSFAMVVLSLVNQVWLPRVFKVEGRSERLALVAEMRSFLERLLRPIVLGLSFATPFALLLFVPRSFHPDKLVIVACIVLVSTLPSGRYATNLWVLLGDGKTTSLAIASLLCAVGNLVLNIILVPIIGIKGSAAATFIAYLGLAWLSGLAIKNSPRLSAPRIMRDAAPALAIACIGVGSSWVPVTLPWMIARAGAALCCALWLLTIVQNFRSHSAAL